MSKFIFPCTQCGACCKNISGCEELRDFDIGNGICRYLNSDNKCEIYPKRPLVCNGEYIYVTLYSNKLDFQSFCNEMQQICKKLRTMSSR